MIELITTRRSYEKEVILDLNNVRLVGMSFLLEVLFVRIADTVFFSSL